MPHKGFESWNGLSQQKDLVVIFNVGLKNCLILGPSIGMHICNNCQLQNNNGFDRIWKGTSQSEVLWRWYHIISINLGHNIGRHWYYQLYRSSGFSLEKMFMDWPRQCPDQLTRDGDIASNTINGCLGHVESRNKKNCTVSGSVLGSACIIFI